MTPLFIALQIAVPMMQGPPGPDTPPAPPPVAPAPAPPTPAPVAPPPVAPAPTAPQQYPPQPYPPQPYPPQPPSWQQPYWQGATPPPPGPPRPITPPIAERDVRWWARFEMGLGTYGLAETNGLLNEMGYGGVKMWTTLDVAWMFHRRVGAGFLLGMNRRSSQPDNAPALNLTSYFIAAEIPIFLAGNRTWSFYLTPRGGYAAGDFEFDVGAENPLNHTGTFGGAVSFQSFKYHLGGSVGFMHTPVGKQAELGRPLDFGGLYFTIGATIDG